MSGANNLSSAQEERLHLVAEEASEVIKACMKILRHGYDSRNPDDPNSVDNGTDLEIELGNLKAAVVRLYQAGDIEAINVGVAFGRKQKEGNKWMHYQDNSDPFEKTNATQD